MKKRIGLICLMMLGALTARSADWTDADPRAELEKIPWLKETARRENRVWQTTYDDSQKETPYESRIVSYAGKWTRHSFGGHGGLGADCSWRYANTPFTASRSWQEIGQLVLNEVDVDGDGDKADDFVFSLPFSMEIPHGIPDWPAADVFPERLNGTFYGGTTFYCANNTPDQLRNFSEEMGINPDHNPPFLDSRAEDHPINGQRHRTIPGSFLKHYVTMVWKKEDFLNNGNRFRVSFDENSRLAVLVTRGYWYGWNDVRYVVQNGETLYISEIMPDIPDYPFKDARRLKKPAGFLPVCYPLKTRWAVYKPEGWKLDFNSDNAEFKEIQFNDVQAVGWYLAKTDHSTAQTHCKWYGFECDAVVNAPDEPSPTMEMKEIKAAGLPPFNMAACELPYNLWRDIYRWGDSPSHILQARYIYDKSGSMGSMGFGKREHEHDEPLTDLTFYDMLALCNTLSEMEGKEPCYYLDPEFKTLFKNQHLATRATHTQGKDAGESVQRRNFQSPAYESVPVPKIFVNWAANGHRLPTAAEWLAAAGTLKTETGNLNSDGTGPVGTGKPNANGLYDMAGNVRELCWTFGDVYDPELDPPVTAMGGDFTGADPSVKPASPYGDTPYDGDPRIGIRLVCREPGLAVPPMDDKGISPRWTFKKGDVVGSQAKANPVKEPVLAMAEIPGGSYVRYDKKTVKVAPFSMAQYEVSFDRWKTVRQWAEANGYDFYKNGDMGNMVFFDFTHLPDEPVTHITWFDMITWCNALSEMEGRAPCYYEDEACTKVVRNAFAYRPIKLEGHEYIAEPPHPLLKYIEASYAKPFVFTRWDTDGYRLPTAAEMDYAIRGGTTSAYFWGDNEADSTEYVWDAKNSGGRTHPTGQKKPNPFGLYDIQGNVKEWTFSTGNRRDGSRPYEFDLDNPIHSPFYGYGQPPAIYAPILGAVLVGPGWMYGGKNVNGQHGVAVESGGDSDLTHYYSDVGFRPVRCETGTHPRNGLRPLAEKEIRQYMKADPAEFKEAVAYRGGLRRSGVFDASGLTAVKGVRWKAEIGGAINSSPVVFENTLYIGGADGFYALNNADGSVRWKYATKVQVDSSACVADGTVCFTTTAGELVALNTADGTVKWVYKGQATPTSRGSPGIAYGAVFAPVGREIVAVGLQDGKKIWGVDENVPDEYSSLAMTAGSFVSAGHLTWGFVKSYDYATSEMRWVNHGGGVYYYKTAAIGEDGSIYINTTQGTHKFGPEPTEMPNVPKDKNAPLWYTFLLDKMVEDNEMIPQAAPAVWKEIVYAGRYDGKLCALNVKDGKPVWQKKYSGSILSDPAVAAKSGLLVFGCYDGNLYAVDAATGEDRWQFKTGGKIFSSPWIGDGVVYIASQDGYVYALQ